MNTEQLEYEPPVLAEIGDFAELTRLTCCGRWVDNPFGWQTWFL